MRFRVNAALSAGLLIVATFAVIPARADDVTMVGRWFTEGTENKMHLQVFLDNKSDGTYEKDIVAIENCEVAGHWHETGTWTFSDGKFATSSEAVDGMPVKQSPDTHDLFTTSRYDDSHIGLFDTKTKIVWALTLVPSQAAFPPPRGCTV